MFNGNALALVLIVAGWAVPAFSASAYFYSGGQRWPLEVSYETVAVQTSSAMDEKTAAQVLGNLGGSINWEGARSFPDQRTVLVPVANPSAANFNRVAAALRKNPVVQRLLRTYRYGGSQVVVTGDLVVRFKTAMSPSALQRLCSRYAVEAVRPLGNYAPNGYLLRVRDVSRQSPVEVAKAIYEREAVYFSHPDFIWPRSLRFTPNDTLYTNQWHLNNTGQTGGVADADIDAAEAWEVTRGSDSITIAIIDEGVDLDHEDFQATGKIVPGYDFMSNDDNPRPGSGENHGTSVSGIMTAVGNNGVGVTGVAPNCKLMAVRLGSTTSSEASSFQFAADHGADVINNSWGPFDGLHIIQPLPDVTRAGIDYAADQGRGGKGCVIFWAAGNGNESADLDGYASYSKVICVAATTHNDYRAYYSDFGASVDVAAPGDDITTTDRTGLLGYSPGNYTDTFSGTSASSPVACAVGALILSANPGLTRAQVQNILQNSADKIDQAGGAYDVNGHSDKYGYGRVNASAAVQAAAQGGSSLSVSGITPNSATNTGSVSVTNLAGTGFQAGATVNLSKSGQSDIPAANVVVVSATQITCDFGLSGKATGAWNVVVTNPDQTTASLGNGFTITAPETHDVVLSALSASPNPVSRGVRVSFVCTVSNLGNVTESNLKVQLSLNGQTLGKPASISTLPAGQSTSVTIRFKVPFNTAVGSYLITSEVSTVSGETNTDNNKATVKVTVK